VRTLAVVDASAAAGLQTVWTKARPSACAARGDQAGSQREERACERAQERGDDDCQGRLWGRCDGGLREARTRVCDTTLPHWAGCPWLHAVVRGDQMRPGWPAGELRRSAGLLVPYL